MSKAPKFVDVAPKLSDESLLAIADFGFQFMTPVQASTIPLFLQHKDVCVEATTGSGKTLAFGIPIFEMIHNLSTPLEMHEVGAIVLAPTRELAMQIHEVFTKLSVHHKGIECVLFVGGTSVQEDFQRYESQGGQIIVGTPGRILDIFSRHQSLIKLKALKVLVLDEADTLLDMGFKDSINQILAMLPKQRRTGLFSATQTKEVKELARAGLRNPVSVSVKVQHDTSKQAVTTGNGTTTAQSTPTSLENWYLMREYDQRPLELLRFIHQHIDQKIIIFCATCACVDYYSNAFHQLTKHSNWLPSTLTVLGFHGKMIVKKRTANYKRFKSLSAGVMFSTDVAARGIDIPDVDWIVQLAAPKDPAFFVHRVGRTARAGRRGGALLFLTPEEEAYVPLLRGRGVPLLNGDDEQLQRAFATVLGTPLMAPETLSIVTETLSTGNATKSGDKQSQQQKKKKSASNDGDSSTTPSSSSASGHSNVPATHAQVLEALKDLAKKDRDLLEEGSTAFMSYIKAYKEHLCSYIFRLENLDIGALGRSYGLLRLPKIAETRGVKGKPIRFDTDSMDTSTIPYRHREKEQARLRRLALAKEQAAREESEPHDEHLNKKLKKGEKGEWVPAEQFERVDKKRERKAKKSTRVKMQEEWDDLAVEEMLYKKFKRGKLSKAEYDDLLTSDKALDEELFDEKMSKRNGNKKRSHQDSEDDSDDEDFSDSDLSE